MKWLDKTIGNKMIFRMLYLFISLCFVTVIKYLPGLKVLNTVVIAWGIILILIEFYKIFKYKKPKYIYILYGFLIFTLILNIFVYFNMENIKIWLINCILIFVVFGVDVEKNKQKLKREVKIISCIYLGFIGIITIISLININLGNVIEFKEVIDGKVESVEFTHLFTNENSFGISCAIAIFLSIYCIFEFKNKFIRSTLIVNILILLFGVIESKGRSAIVLLLSILVVAIIISLKKYYLRIPAVLLPFGAIIYIVYKNLSLINIENLNFILTGRQYLWYRGLQVIKDSSIWGLGNESFVPIMLQTDSVRLPGLQNGGLHNIYLQISVVNGIISLVILITFLICMCVYLLNIIDKKNIYQKCKWGILFSLIVGILIVNLLESNLLYIVSFVSMIFWIYSGYLVAILSKEREDDKSAI